MLRARPRQEKQPAASASDAENARGASGGLARWAGERSRAQVKLSNCASASGVRREGETPCTRRLDGEWGTRRRGSIIGIGIDGPGFGLRGGHREDRDRRLARRPKYFAERWWVNYAIRRMNVLTSIG